MCCAINELAKEPGSAGAGAVKNDLARVLANVLVITASMLSAKPPKFTKKVIVNVSNNNNVECSAVVRFTCYPQIHRALRFFKLVLLFVVDVRLTLAA